MGTFTTKQISEALGVSEETVRRWIRTGGLEAESIGKSYRVQESDLMHFLNQKGVSLNNGSLAKMALAGTALAAALPIIAPVGAVGSVLAGLGTAAMMFKNQQKKNEVNIPESEKEMQHNEAIEIDLDGYIDSLEKELEQLKKIKRAKDLQKQIDDLKQSIDGEEV